MKILICDDMQAEATKLAGLFAGSGFEINTVVFNNAGDALAYIRSGGFIEVCFLDIIMPQMSGVALASQLRAEGYKGQIVFLSTSKDYGPETYTVKAFTYLLKPATPESVKNVLQELFDARKDSDTGGIAVKKADGVRHVLFREISHAEVIRNAVYYRLTDGSELEARTTFAEVAGKLLGEGRFAQCHRSYIVNMDAVSGIQGNNFIMRDGAVVPISRSWPEAKDQYLRRVLGGGEK